MNKISLPAGYTPKRFIASGGYGSVYLIERDPEEEGQPPAQFAVKIIADYQRRNIIAREKYKREYLKRMAREVNFCRHFQGCYEFVGYEAMYRSPYDNNLYIIMNYATHNLREVTLQTKLEEPIVRFLTAQILSGLHKMHSRQCSHRDLSSRNILVDLEHAFAYICDFGLSRAHVNSDANLTVEVVTLPYRAPELLMLCPNYDPYKVDVWSVGILVVEMIARSAPVAQKDILRQLVGLFSELIPFDYDYWKPPRVSPSARKFLTDYKERFEANNEKPKLLDVMADCPTTNTRLSPDGMEVLRSMLAARPEDRKSCYDLLQMDWFKKDETCWQQIQVMLANEGTPDEELRLDLELSAADVPDDEAINRYIAYIEEAVPMLDDAVECLLPQADSEDGGRTE